jgi:sRNA-binding carbon storage regulator CsrA
MLVIHRQEDEGFYLIDQATGEKTLVMIGRKNGRGVKVAIDAPKRITVLRRELVDGPQQIGASKP